MRARLDQGLLKKTADKTRKSLQYVREQTARRASRLSVTSEAALVLWAKELGLGTGAALRRLPPHVQEQVRTAVPSAPHPPRRPEKDSDRSRKPVPADPVGLAIDHLLSDGELRDRCRDLLKRSRYFDRVLREATTVLENRIKSQSGLTGSILPAQLVSKALNPDLNVAILHVSTEPSEQEGFHSVCRGIVLGFRHRAHHKLDDKVTREYAFKFCAFIDLLLGILGKATRRAGA